MARLALALVLALLTSGPGSAEPVSGLYRGEAIIPGQDNLDERARGMRLALVPVLVQACGDDRVADPPWWPAILAKAENGRRTGRASGCQSGLISQVGV